MDRLLTCIKRDAKSAQDRVVIVSSFTSVLDLLKCLCRERRWSTLRLDGSTPPDERQKVVKYFNQPAGQFYIMLLSAKAGGVGLTLTGANRLVLMEPDFNPATDAQAMGRVYREGQMKPVYVYRLLGRGTIDEQIIERQVKKVLYHYHSNNGIRLFIPKPSICNCFDCCSLLLLGSFNRCYQEATKLE